MTDENPITSGTNQEQGHDFDPKWKGLRKMKITIGLAFALGSVVVSVVIFAMSIYFLLSGKIGDIDKKITDMNTDLREHVTSCNGTLYNLGVNGGTLGSDIRNLELRIAKLEN